MARRARSRRITQAGADRGRGWTTCHDTELLMAYSATNLTYTPVHACMWAVVRAGITSLFSLLFMDLDFTFLGWNPQCNVKLKSTFSGL